MAFAAITGTVVDPHGIAYAYGRITADFVRSATEGTYYTYGSSLNPAPIQTREAGLDSTGAFTLSLPKTTEVLPADGQWKFTVTSADGVTSFNYTTTVTADASITAGLVAAASLLSGNTTPLTATITLPQATIAANVRTIYGKISPTYTGAVTTGNVSIVGVRGECNIPANVTSTTGGYYYGTQGKFISATTLNNGSGFNCGLFGQLDVSSATFAHTSGYMAPIIADFSTAAHLATDALADMMVLLNTSQCLINSIIKTEAKAAYLLDLNDLGQGQYIVATAKSSGWDKSLKILINGTPYYIPCNSAAS